MYNHVNSETFQILGVNISSFSRDEFFTVLKDRLQITDINHPPLFVVTVNPEIAIQSITDNHFREILQSSDINTADGIGITWAIKQLYNKSVERITGSDSLEKICKICASWNQSVFFYGAAPGVAHKAATLLSKRNQGLDIQGVYSPETPDINFEQLPAATQIELQQASVVFVALGAPSQEKWIYNNLNKLKNCKLIMGIGGSFDFIAGHQKRAPLLYRKFGLEWVYRLYKEPSRWRRMLRLPLFALNIMLLKASNTNIKNTSSMQLSKKEVV